MNLTQEIKSQINDSINTKKTLIESALDSIANATGKISDTLKQGNKLLLCGNGGSAADAQHIAAEFIGRFKKERKALPAIALTTDTSILTCLSNDYGYETVFSRQVEALGKKGDILLGISTSGNSKNLLNAVVTAKKIGMFTIGLTGGNGGNLKQIVDLDITVPSHETPRIQESQILIGHIICDIVEKTLFA